MIFRCPHCGYGPETRYPLTEKEWDVVCPNCGSEELEFLHIGFPMYHPGSKDHWVLIRHRKVIGYDPCDEIGVKGESDGIQKDKDQ